MKTLCGDNLDIFIVHLHVAQIKDQKKNKQSLCQDDGVVNLHVCTHISDFFSSFLSKIRITFVVGPEMLFLKTWSTKNGLSFPSPFLPFLASRLNSCL